MERPERDRVRTATTPEVPVERPGFGLPGARSGILLLAALAGLAFPPVSPAHEEAGRGGDPRVAREAPRARTASLRLPTPAVPTHRDVLAPQILNLAVRNGDIETVASLLSARPALINTRDDGGFTPLHVAAFYGREEVSRLLVRRGARIDARSDAVAGLAVTPLHVAAQRGAGRVVDLLLSSGADVNAGDRNGVTPLHMSAFLGLTDIAARLVARCADVNVREGEGLTPLHVASDMGFSDIVGLLLANGADAAARDTRGRTARNLAESHHDAGLAELLDRGGRVSAAEKASRDGGRCRDGV